MTLDSHAVLAMLDPGHRISKVGISNKMFEAMVTGRPCIVTEGLLMAEIVDHEECGLIVPYTNAGFRGAVERLRDDHASQHHRPTDALPADVRRVGPLMDRIQRGDLQLQGPPGGTPRTRPHPPHEQRHGGDRPSVRREGARRTP